MSSVKLTEVEISEMIGKSWHDIMKKYKPEITLEEADYILLNETCYPFDDKTTYLKQFNIEVK